MERGNAARTMESEETRKSPRRSWVWRAQNVFFMAREELAYNEDNVKFLFKSRCLFTLNNFFSFSDTIKQKYVATRSHERILRRFRRRRAHASRRTSKKMDRRTKPPAGSPWSPGSSAETVSGVFRGSWHSSAEAEEETAESARAEWRACPGKYEPIKHAGAHI